MRSLPTQAGLVLTVLACLLLAVITVKSELRNRRLAKIWFLFNVLIASWAFFWWLGAFFLRSPSGRWFAMYLANWIAVALPPLFVSFVVTFLDSAERFRLTTRASWAFSFALMTAALLYPRAFVVDMQKIQSAYLPVAGPLLWTFAVQYTLLVLAGIGLLYSQMRTLEGWPRKKAGDVLVACGIGFLGGATTFPPALGIVHTYPYGVAIIPIYSVLTTYAILHHRLMDIRLVIRDTTLHVLTAATLAIGTLVIGLPLAGINGYVGVFSSVFLMAAMMAVAYEPIRRLLQPAIDRVMFANRFAYLEELGHLPNDLLEFTNLREMLKFLVTRLTEAARLERVRILMYDPGHQSYLETMVHERTSSGEAPAPEEPRELSENSSLVALLKTDGRLWTRNDFIRFQSPNAGSAIRELDELNGAAFFPVKRGDDLLGVVILGPKRSREPFNQHDLEILRALQIRLENFLSQAMTITQEALNMVKDSHDMKNDINALQGRVTWRSMRDAGWWTALEKDVRTIEGAMAKAGLGAKEKQAAQDALADLLAQSRAWHEEIKKSGPVEDNALKRLAHRLRNWAEYGRVVSEGFRGQRVQERVDVAQTTRLSVERWRPIAERKGLELSAQSSGQPFVWGERSLLEQIIENLIDNALKATTAGSVRVRCRLDHHSVIVEVRDTGCGIPPEDLATIFDKPFYQGRGREQLEQSTGVGLYLVAQYAKSLGGRVGAESQLGKGSAFLLTLPAFLPERRPAGAAA